MMKKIFLMTFLGITSLVSAQESYTLSDKSTLSIDGSSSLTDWTVTAGSMEGSIAIMGNENTIEFSVPVGNIKGDRADAMNTKMHDALKKEEHPSVTVSVSGLDATNGGKQNLEGTMTIAGVEKEVTIPATVSREDGQLQLSGEQNITLQDYGIEPPTAMFGSIVVGDEVTVKFDLNFDKE